MSNEKMDKEEAVKEIKEVINKEEEYEQIKLNKEELKEGTEEGIKVEVKEVKKEEAKEEAKEEKNKKEVNNSWSFSGLWGTASKVLEDTKKSEYFQTNLSSVRSAINEISENVKNNEHKKYLNTEYLSTTMNKLGSEIKELTKESMSNVIDTLKPSEEYIQQLDIYVIANQDFKVIQNDIQQLWDHLIEDYGPFKKISINNGRALLEEGQNALSSDTLQLLDVAAPGFTEAYNVAKFKVEKGYSAYENQTVENEEKQKQVDFFKNIENQLMIPIKTTSAYLCIQSLKAHFIEGANSEHLLCLALYCPSLNLPLLHTFSQAFPKHIVDLLVKNGNEDFNLKDLDESHQITIYQIIQFAIRQLLTDFILELKKVNLE